MLKRILYCRTLWWFTLFYQASALVWSGSIIRRGIAMTGVLAALFLLSLNPTKRGGGLSE